jgi:hypothetical protein
MEGFIAADRMAGKAICGRRETLIQEMDFDPRHHEHE